MIKNNMQSVLRTAQQFLLCAIVLCLPSILLSCSDDDPDNPTSTQNPTGSENDSDSSGTDGDINNFEYVLGAVHDCVTYYDPDIKEYTYSITVSFGVENMYSKNLAVFGMVVNCDDGDIYTSTDSNDDVRAEEYGRGYYIWDIILSDKLDMAHKSILVYSKKSRITLELTPRWGFSWSNKYFKGATTTKTFTPCSSI